MSTIYLDINGSKTVYKTRYAGGLYIKSKIAYNIMLEL